MDGGGGMWSLLTIVSPLLLGAALVFALLKNRNPTPRDEARTEAATKRLYEQEDAEGLRQGGDRSGAVEDHDERQDAQRQPGGQATRQRSSRLQVRQQQGRGEAEWMAHHLGHAPFSLRMGSGSRLCPW